MESTEECGHEFDLCSGVGREEDIFFPPEQWSRRFGSAFFTVRLEGWRSQPDFDEFQLQVERGEDDSEEGSRVEESSETKRACKCCRRREGMWTVYRRYSEFLELKRQLEENGLEVEDDQAGFPPKLYFWQKRDPQRVDERCVALRKWLYAQLRKGDVVHFQTMREFLEL